ncbi:MAG: ABC transporter ATP-binding protein [Proteobacteria bacterium]|nr:ABC transporter ATP-binding protein [Pseudomonadota bacterium]
MLLEVKRINTFYDVSHILFDVSLEIDDGEVVCILGRNGVGKTTTVRSIMGLTPPRSGSVVFNGIEIQRKQPFEIAHLGLGFVPEDRIIFPDLSVRENLEIGIKREGKGQWTFERIYEIFPILKIRVTQMGGTLSGGEQQMLTIARTLMGNPRLLLLDEPSEGLAPLIVKEIGKQVHSLKTEGMTIFLSEQNSSFSLRFSDRAYILEKGEVKWKGEVGELKERPEIMKTYLGV